MPPETQNAEETASLVTPEMEAKKGVWEDERVSPPVGPAEIRRWAIAVYWPEKPPRIFWDEEYAQGTRWGGIVAPQDFNPFAWPIDRPARAGGAANAPNAGRGGRVMNGGQTDTYGTPIRPGDVITTRTRLADWNERPTRLGHTLFSFTETEWRNQNDEFVKRRISTSIRY